MAGDGDGAEDVDVLTERGDLLAHLCGGPASKGDLLDTFDMSRSTLDRAVRRLEEMDLVERDGTDVTATVAGRLAVENLDSFQSTLSDIRAAEAVVEPLPLDAPIAREAVAGSDALLADEPVPHRPLERFHDALADADRYRAALPALADPRHIRLLYDHVVTEGNPAELIVSSELFRALRTEFPRRMATLAETEGFDLLVGDVPPFALAVVDEDTGRAAEQTVFVGVFTDARSGMHGLLVNGTVAARHWAEERYAEIEADARERTEALLPDADGGAAIDTDGGAVQAIRGSLSSALEREGFVRLETSYFREEPVADPTTAWRAGLTIPEVHTGYDVDRLLPADGAAGESERRPMATALHEELAAGTDCVVVGPPGSGKSTVCKQVACEWYDDRGPVLYREQGRGRPFQSVDSLAATVDAADGHTLVVVEDAVRPECHAVFAAIDRLGDRDDVSFLLDSRETEWRESTGNRPDVTGLSVTHMPPLEDDDIERLIDHFERTSNRTVDVPVDRLHEEVRDETDDDGTAPHEVLLLLHRLATYVDPLADDRTSLEDAVATRYDELTDTAGGPGVSDTPARESGDLVLDVCVLANVLNAAGVGVTPGLLYAVASPTEYAAVDSVLDRLEGTILFPRKDGSYRTVHEAWSVAFLTHLVDAEGETAAAERFGRCVSRLLALADDPAKREAIVGHLGGRTTLAAVVDAPGQWADETVEMVYTMGRERPKLSPLFGDGEDDTIVLPDSCSPAVVDERPVRLGWMFFSAGEFDRAKRAFDRLPDDGSDRGIERLLGLATVELSRGNAEEARSRVETCLTLVDGDEQPHKTARAHLKLGDALQQLSEFEAASEQFSAALDGFEAVGDRRRLAQTLNGFGRVSYRRGEHDQAQHYHERSLEIAREIGDRHNQASSLNNLGRVAMESGKYHQALEYYERSLEIKRNIGDRHGEANGLNNIGMVYNMLGRYEEALEYGERSLELKRDLGDRHGEANTCSTLGIVAASSGDHERAREYFERSAEIKRDLGDRIGEAMALNNLANVASRQSEYEAARESAERAREIKRDLGAGQGVAEVNINLGEIARLRGRYDRARDYLEQAREVARDSEDQHSLAQTLDRLGAVARRQGDRNRATELLDRAQDLAEDVGDPGLLSKLHHRRGELALADGDYDRARAQFEQAHDLAEGGDQLDVTRIRLARARLALGTGDRETARERAQHARETYADLGTAHFEARSRRVLGRIAADAGESDTARDHFEAALDTFETVGVPQDELTTLQYLVEVAETEGDDESRQQWYDRAEACLETAPDPVVENHREWIERHLDANGADVDRD